jgi:adenylate cyclase class IV
VRGLGEFVEVEAISRTNSLTKVREQAGEFQRLFQIASEDFVGESYSDLMLAKGARDKQAHS